MRDPFDELLKEAKRHRHFENLRQAQALAKTAKPQVEVKIEPERPKYQLEAPGWYEARTILVVRENEDHSLTPLGVYIEHCHPQYGRHLVPCPSLDTAQNREVVHTWGDVRPRIEPVIETEEEITAIRNRFHSLLEELAIEDDEEESAINGF